MDFIDNFLYQIKIPIYKTTMYILHITYVLALFGFIFIDPNYVNKLNIAAQLFVCLFLILRFHPFRSHELHKYDSQIIFGSALFLLANLGITQYFMYNLQSKTSKVHDIILGK
jgi:hypothetical protein